MEANRKKQKNFWKGFTDKIVFARFKPRECELPEFHKQQVKMAKKQCG